MFLGFCAVLLIAAVPFTGGSLGRLATIRLRGVGLALSALALQVLVITVWPTMPHDFAVAGHLLSYAMLAVVVWWNRRLPGMVVMAVGAGCNALAITVNGGTLPASASAMRAAGLHSRPGFDNSDVLSHPHLSWLGDVMVSPGWLPLRNMVSIGDLLLLVGAAILVLRVTRSPGRHRALGINRLLPAFG